MSPQAAGGGLGTGLPRLLERDRELAVLDRAIAGAIAGGSGLVLVEGPAGIGKSRLVAETRRRAADAGLLVLTARGGELERDFPFGVVRQLFEPRLADEAVRERVLGGAAGAAAAVFGLPGGRAEDASGEWTFAALHGLYWLTVNLSAEAPLLLAVDDLHWCDRTSLRFLAYLGRRLEGLPVLVVGSLRAPEAGADEGLLAELESDPGAHVLAPGPLSLDAAGEVVRERLGEGVAPAFAKACHASTHGNPLLLNELLKALQAERVPPDDDHVHVVAELGRQRLGEGPAQRRDRRIRRALRERGARGRPEHVDDPTLAGPRHRDDVGGDVLRRRLELEQEPCRTQVAQLPLARRQVAVDRGLDERVDEPERRLGAHDLRADELPVRGGDRLASQPCQLADDRRLRPVAQDRERARHGHRVG